MGAPPASSRAPAATRSIPTAAPNAMILRRIEIPITCRTTSNTGTAATAATTRVRRGGNGICRAAPPTLEPGFSTSTPTIVNGR
ncbi:Uncharacterised protein [Mycobacteroides abscessus subsp. abscessus]|nr:Uncharacterised protein [Mycobacteroides abscessus subsp. abscessus]